MQALNAALVLAVDMADAKARLALDALAPATGTPAALQACMKNDFESWKQVVQQQNLKIEAF